jgi:hypothetical protein
MEPQPAKVSSIEGRMDLYNNKIQRRLVRIKDAVLLKCDSKNQTEWLETLQAIYEDMEGYMETMDLDLSDEE